MKKGYDEKYGARPLKRVIQKYIEDIIAEEIISNNIGYQISDEGNKIPLYSNSK